MPLIKFLASLLQVFRVSSNKLVKECFNASIFTMISEPKYEGSFDVAKYVEEFERFDKHFDEKYQKPFEKLHPFEAIVGNLKFLLNEL